MKRNTKAVKANLYAKDGKLMTKKDTIVHLLTGLKDKKLILPMGEQMSIVGSFSIVHGDSYAVFNANAMFKTTPDHLSIVKIEDQDYYQLEYKANTAILDDNTVVKFGDIAQDLVYYYVFNGHTPYFMDYEDKARCVNTADRYSAIRIDQSPEVIEMLVAAGARAKNDVEQLVRNTSKTKTNWSNKDIKWIPISRVEYTLGSFNKLVGTHQRVGVMSSLVNDTDNITSVERVTRA